MPDSPFSVAAKHDMTSKEYADAYFNFKDKGYRLQCVSGYEEGSAIKFAAVWKKEMGSPLASFHQLTGAEYQEKYNLYDGQGFKLTFVNAFRAQGKVWYSAIWEKKDGPDVKGFHGLTSQEYNDKYFSMKNSGYRLRCVSGVDGGNQAYFAGIWEKTNGPSLATHHMMTSADYQEKFNDYGAKGYRLSHLQAFVVDGKDYYAAIWEKNADSAQWVHHRLSEPNYQTMALNYFYQGFTMEQTCAYTLNGKTTFAARWGAGEFSVTEIQKIEAKVEAFLKKYEIPGLTMAIAKDEKLVFARGYGYADTEKNLLMGPQHIGRIASVSKPITAVAILLLAEKFPTKITLNSKVFGSGSIFGSDYGTKDLSANEKAIQVDNLLEHTAGGNVWDNNDVQNQSNTSPQAKEDPVSYDPMFQYSGKSHSELITSVLDDREPDYPPGKLFAYSNFGYCVLGRIVEKISGQSYSNWVKNNVLKPCGITQMTIANNDLADKKSNEFVLYGQDVDKPYGSDCSRMDSHGGWLAAPIDLVRFAVRVDGKPGKPDIINAASFAAMTSSTSYAANPVKTGNYGKGWTLTDDGFQHGGDLPGMKSKLAVQNDGFTYAILVNSRVIKDDIKAKAFSLDFDNLISNLIPEIGSWPEYDLF
jgi:CubicO group peptidase (beta-lactamase class C family)